MKNIITLYFCFFLTAFCTHAQMFWVENFESGSTSGTVVSSYTGPNGAWTLTVTGTEGAGNNQWYVSCAENGHTTGVCGTGCAPVTPTATLATLHVGSTTLGDMGASYDAGPLPNTTTDRRATSPTINCTGKYGIEMEFYYIMDGQAGIDYATVWYYDGTTWSLLSSPAQTPPICPPVGGISQGYWDHYTVYLPVSANNNPNVKIGFRWVNNNDGVGTDPSFAVDSVSLTTASTAVPVPSFSVTPSYTLCQDSCMLLKNTSTGPIDSLRWSCTGGTIANPNRDTTTVCFYTPGVYTMSLVIYRSGTSHTSTHTVTVNPTPHPAITSAGHTLSVTGSYSAYQWSYGITPITGATGSSYTFSVSGTYGVAVDSGGCWGWNSFVISTTGISSINGYEIKYWSAPASGNRINLYASEFLNEAIDISVFDLTGRQILNDTWIAGTETKQINGSYLSPGLYIIKLSNNSTSMVFRWVR